MGGIGGCNNVPFPSDSDDLTFDWVESSILSPNAAVCRGHLAGSGCHVSSVTSCTRGYPLRRVGRWSRPSVACHLYIVRTRGIRVHFLVGHLR